MNYSAKKINSFIPDIPINEESRDKLFSLAISHDLSGLEEFITTNSISLNVKNNNNQTIIHVLLDSENTTDEKELLRCITFLVDRGAYISSSDKFLLTPLFICIKKNYSDIFSYLLKNGASLNINTYDDLTVMHELAKSEHITYDANGIQSIIPEKLPKFDIEKYNEIKTKIDNILSSNITLQGDLINIKNITRHFYYNDYTEDFNNKLLINEYKNNLYNEKKTDIFEKIKSKLDIFYSSEIIEEIKVEELLDNLNIIKQKLNDETQKIIMQDLNNQVFNAIKSMAYSLQLRNHFFFVDNIGLSHIATYQIIHSINYRNTETSLLDILNYNNNNNNNMRAIIKITEAALVAIKEYTKNNEDNIILIKNTINYFVFYDFDFNNYTIKENQMELLRRLNNNINININIISESKKNELKNKVFDLLNELAYNDNYPQIVKDIIAEVNNLIIPTNNQIITLTDNLNFIHFIMQIFIDVNNIKTDVDTIAILDNNKLAARAVYTGALLISVYFYINFYINLYINTEQNVLITNIPCIKALLQTTILSAIPEKELTELQIILKDPIVAIEVVLEAVYQIIFNIIGWVNPADPIDEIKSFIINTIENVDDFVISNIAIDIVINIVNTCNDYNILLQALNNKVAIRTIIEVIEVAKKFYGINEEIITIFKDCLVNSLINNPIQGIKIKIVEQLLHIDNIEIDTLYLINSVIEEYIISSEKLDKLRLINEIEIVINELDILNKPREIIDNTKVIIDLFLNFKNNIINLNFTDAINTVIHTAILGTVYAAIDIKMQHIIKDQLIRIFLSLQNLIPLEEEVKKVLISAIQTTIQTIVLSTIPAEKQLIYQEQLKNPIVAVEVKLATLKYIGNFIEDYRDNYYNYIPKDIEIFKEAIKKAIKLPQIIPNILKNQDYNELIKSYKLINIPQRYFMLDNNNINKDNSLEGIIKELTKGNGLLNNYKIIDNNTIHPQIKKLPDNNIIHHINFFNLLYTFNEYAKNNYNPKLLNDSSISLNNNNIFLLYQNIQQIYKYNYIIYIFEKEKDKILQLKDHYNNDHEELKNKIDNVFNNNFKELENSIYSIKEKLKKIEELANQYIDIYNKINGLILFFNMYKKTNIYKHGIYPKIKFPTITKNDIKYTLNTENAKILECSYDYIKYNDHKNDFFHNFVLYFQDIGIGILNKINVNVNLLKNHFLNSIPFNYNYDQKIKDYKQNYNYDQKIKDYNKNKLFKLFFYNPIYLKLYKQNSINYLLNIPEIKNINTINNDILNKTVSNEFNEKIKTDILNKIFENQFDTMLINAIENLFKQEMSINSDKIEYDISIKEPDFNTILLQSFGFKHILIPNYEFTNNKFISISTNKFLLFVLYFDTHYFKPCNISKLEYYKENKFIKNILKTNKSLLLKTDIKGWTPIYYAIDSNNFNVIKEIIDENDKTLKHYDNKHISPLQLCINKQSHHLNYLLDDNDNIHYLNNYIKMLRNELKSNDILIPLNIDAVFIIALFIQNHIWVEDHNKKKKDRIILDNILKENTNTRRIQINREYNNIKKSDVDNNDFKFNDTDVKKNNKREIKYEQYKNENYNSDSDLNIIFKKYNLKAKELEEKDFGLYGSYWINYKKNNYYLTILEHINNSINLKKILKELKLIEKKNTDFNIPKYDNKDIIDNKKKIEDINKKCEHYLKFINIRFNSNKDNAYTVFLNKIYVHVLANIIGVDFYLTMEELIIKHYIGKGAIIDTSTNSINSINIKKQLLVLNKYLINNKLEEDKNFNYLYINQINQQKNPELIFKGVIIEILKKVLLGVGNDDLINTYESIILPRYRDLYKITYKYLKMFMSNYHKFIYNQYHGLNILLELLKKLQSS